MENFYAVQLRRILQPSNFLARLVTPRITTRSHHDAHRRIVRPLKIAVAGAAVDRRLYGLDQVAFEAHQNGLSLGIAEAAVEFEHHRAARGHYYAARKNAFIFRAFALHAGANGPRDVSDEPVA